MTDPTYRPYTGIGSRKTPEEVLRKMTELAEALERKGYTLRSGGANGADSAFEAGAGLQKEIFLPWRGFNANTSRLYQIPLAAFDLASTLHPTWAALPQAVQKLHARNTQQVLGETLSAPSLFVVFYAPEKNGVVQGGTATAVKLARSKNIPTFNLLTTQTSDILRELA